ncbi:MAG TPA: tetratricopeptide repeat protein, partial [Segetibacter sp.]
LQPFEQKEFVQYFMPYREVGVVKNATKEAVVNIELLEKTAEIKLYVTAPYTKLKVALFENDKEIFSEVISSSPEAPYLRTVVLNDTIVEAQLKLIITDLDTNKELVSYQKDEEIEHEIPSPAQPAKKPEEIENNEQLFLTGLHLEQYRHATYVATDYYNEALRRDPKDVRSNNAMGVWYLRRGQFVKAEGYFKKAIATLTQRNPNPYDGEPYHNLGWALKMQDKNEEAYGAFFKSVWNDAWQHAGYLNLARIACIKKDFEEALNLIDSALVKNYHSHTARHAKVFILRKLGKKNEALNLISESLNIDPFNFGCLFESYFLFTASGEIVKAQSSLEELKKLSRNWVHNFIEYAFDYAHAGLFEDASALLKLQLQDCDEPYPMVYYYLGWFESKLGNHQQALEYFKTASSLSSDFCFPNRIEDVPVLQKAMALNTRDAKAPYYIGNFWYDKRQYEDAINCWEKSIQIDDSLATVHRNLSLAYYNRLKDPINALSSLEKAFMLDKKDARVLMELDQLYKRLNTPHKQRLTLLEEHIALVESRDDLYLECITLYNQLGDYEKSKALLATYRFHPWEGGEGKAIGQFLICHLELAKKSIKENDYAEALTLLDAAENYPSNLGEGKLYGVQENDILYLKGI